MDDVGGQEFVYPSVATPGPGLKMLRYWSTLHGEASMTSDSGSDSSADGMEAPESSEVSEQSEISTPSNEPDQAETVNLPMIIGGYNTSMED